MVGSWELQQLPRGECAALIPFTLFPKQRYWLAIDFDNEEPAQFSDDDPMELFLGGSDAVAALSG